MSTALTVAALLHLGQQCAPQIAPATLLGQIATESQLRPLALHVNGHDLAQQPGGLDEALRWARWLDARGYSFDAGLGQLNNATVHAFGLRWRQVFDPCQNLAAAQRYLLRDYHAALARNGGDRRRAVLAAYSAYNTGSASRGIANGYVGRVERQAQWAALRLRQANSRQRVSIASGR